MAGTSMLLHFEYDEVEELAEGRFVIYGCSRPVHDLENELRRKLSGGVTVRLQVGKNALNGTVRKFGVMSMGVLFIELEINAVELPPETELAKSGFDLEINM